MNAARRTMVVVAVTLAAAAAALQGPAWALIPPAPASGDGVALSSDLRIRVRSGRYIELEVRPSTRGGYDEVARRVTGSAELTSAIEAWNAGREPRGDSFVRVPLAFLSDEYRALVLLNLFPKDRRVGPDWIHVTRAGAIPTYDEGLWQIAEWFTGLGSNFQDIQKANRLASPEVASGTEVRIPGALLHPCLRAPEVSANRDLVYGKDDRGPYAGYRLKTGEALYSAVVLRFTGRTSREDVSGVAEELIRRSNIRDARDIPVGYLVKIPIELLEPEFLPPGHPGRREADAARAEVEAALAKKPVERTRGGLKGVLVIIDPGHGGRDLGTMNHGIWEHDYVYDVACRLKAKLERETQANVFLTLEDAETGCTPSSGDRLKANYQGTVRSTPPFLAVEEGEAQMAVNLRWYLANSVFRKAVREGTHPDRVVFLSLHADSRHPSLRGLMVYVPGARYRAAAYGHDSSPYRRFSEVREEPRVRFSHRQRVRSEAVSRKLAEAIVAAFGKEGLPVQPVKPVRDAVLRAGRRWIPAVLRGNAVPTDVLVEMVNLSNAEDAALLASAGRRDRIADALVRSLFAYFGEKLPPPGAGATTASRGGGDGPPRDRVVGGSK